MKTRILTLALLATTLVFVSCGNSDKDPANPNNKEKGTLSLALNTNNDFIIKETKGGSKADGELNVNAFKVNVKNPDGSVLKAWNSYADVEETVAIEEGTYLVESYNEEQVPAGFEKPFFYGMQTVTIKAQSVQNVALECKLANTKVTIVFTDKFKAAVKDAAAAVMNNEDGGGILTWPITETRAGYFKSPVSGSKRLVVSVAGINIKTGEPIKAKAINIDGVAPQQWHKVTIDITSSGSMGSEITINTELTEKDITVDIPDSDDVIDNNGDEGSWGDDPATPDPDPTPDPEPSAIPTITGANLNGAPFDIKQPVVIKTTDASTALDVVFTSTVGISKLLLKITSEVGMLNNMFPTEMDLANPVNPSDWYGIFADPSIGIIDPEVPILGKKSHTFSVGGLMSLLAGLGEDVNHNFKVTVVDANGEASETLVIRIVK